MSCKYEALVRLEEILHELDMLSREAEELFRAEFSSLYTIGDAYDAFTFGRSQNPYETTFAKLVEAAEHNDENNA